MSGLGYSSWVLQFLVFFPIVGMAAVLFSGERHAKHLALAFATIELLVSIPLWFVFNPASAASQFAVAAPWIPEWGIFYRVGVDGISLLLVLLTTRRSSRPSRSSARSSTSRRAKRRSTR
jgi:NADH-quinone oxidoreductase subunit M